MSVLKEHLPGVYFVKLPDLEKVNEYFSGSLPPLDSSNLNLALLGLQRLFYMYGSTESILTVTDRSISSIHLSPTYRVPSAPLRPALCQGFSVPFIRHDDLINSPIFPVDIPSFGIETFNQVYLIYVIRDRLIPLGRGRGEVIRNTVEPFICTDSLEVACIFQTKLDECISLYRDNLMNIFETKNPTDIIEESLGESFSSDLKETTLSLNRGLFGEILIDLGLNRMSSFSSGFCIPIRSVLCKTFIFPHEV